MLRSRMNAVSSLLVVWLVCVPAGLVGCGDSGTDGSGTDGTGGSSGTGGDGSIVAPGAPSYQEAAEATNGDKAGGEATGLTLTADGFVIEGTFEASGVTGDHYQFDTGAFGGAGMPDFPGVDAYVFIDGKRYDSAQSEVHLTLDSVVDDGYSTLSAGAFINAAVTSGTDYDLGLTGNEAFAGKAYRIEVRGHTP